MTSHRITESASFCTLRSQYSCDFNNQLCTDYIEPIGLAKKKADRSSRVFKAIFSQPLSWVPETFHADERFPVSVESFRPCPREFLKQLLPYCMCLYGHANKARCCCYIRIRVDGASKNATVERFNDNSVPVSGFTGFVQTEGQFA